LLLLFCLHPRSAELVPLLFFSTSLSLSLLLSSWFGSIIFYIGIYYNL
jgi:hypothetical protein